jgi:hypothetical protein
MFISHKSNVLQTVHETEWQCRRLVKGLDKSEYWTWLATITNAEGVITYPSEIFTIVECRDEDIHTKLNQLDDYVSTSPVSDTVYNIKWHDIKQTAIINGQEIQTHLIGDDVTRDARLLAEMWVRVRNKRNKLLAETDWIVTQAVEKGESVSDSWKTYRESLRNVPDINNNVVIEQNIVWPDKPE